MKKRQAHKISPTEKVYTFRRELSVEFVQLAEEVRAIKFVCQCQGIFSLFFRVYNGSAWQQC